MKQNCAQDGLGGIAGSVRICGGRDGKVGFACRVRVVLASAMVCFGFLMCGCGPRILLDPPEDWHVQWKGRMLYHTPGAMIYASNSLAAGEADRMADDVVRSFKMRYGGEATKGLILVKDVGDSTILDSYKDYYELVRQSEQGTADDSAGPITDEDWETIRLAMEEQGVDLDAELRMSSIYFTPKQLLDSTGFDMKEASGKLKWAIAIPTRRLIEECCRKNMQGKLEKRGVGLFTQVPLAPLVLVEERKMVVTAEANRDVLFFRCLADQEEDWTLEKKDDNVQAFMLRTIDRKMYPVLAHLREVIEALFSPWSEPKKA